MSQMTLRDVEISVNGSWAKDGDQWLVQEVAADGAVTVARTMGLVCRAVARSCCRPTTRASM